MKQIWTIQSICIFFIQKIKNYHNVRKSQFCILFYAWNWIFQSILYFFQGKITTINLDMRNCQLSKCVLQITVINHNTSKMPPFRLRYSSTSTRSCRKASMALEKHKKCFLTVIKQNKHTQYHIRCLKKFHYCADKS